MQLQDIHNLAKGARIQISDEEAQGLLNDLGSTLAYIDQIQQISVAVVDTVAPIHHNSVREDVVTNTPGAQSDVLLAAVPDAKDGFVKVKKIL